MTNAMTTNDRKHAAMAAAASIALLGLGAGCAGGRSSTDPAARGASGAASSGATAGAAGALSGTADSSAARSAAAAGRRRPAPGADLAGPLAPPTASPRAAAPAAPGQRRRSADQVLDLGSDRPAVPVALPSPPRGGATGFDLGDGRRGWIARLPDSGQLPSAAYADGRLFVSGGLASTSVYGLDAATGHMEWATRNLADSGPTAAIAVDDHVLFNTYSCTLFVLDAVSGRERWHRWIGSTVMAQVAVDTGRGLVFAGHPEEAGGSALSAYRLKDGAPVWSRPVDGELLAAPVVADGSVYVSTIGGSTYRFDAGKGKRRWAKRLHATSAPWVAGDALYLSRRERGKEVQSVVSIATGEVVENRRAVDGRYLSDVPSSESGSDTIWSFEGSRPVIAEGVQYDAMGGLIRASDPATGELRWTRRYAAGEGKRSVGAVAVAGPEVVIATRAGEVYGLDVDTGYTLWAYKLGKAIVAQPIVAKGWVYATTTDGAVVGLNVGDGSLDGWHMWGGAPTHNGTVAAAGG